MKVKKSWLLILFAVVFTITSTLTCAYAVEPTDWENQWLKGNFAYKPVCDAAVGVAKESGEKIPGDLELGALAGNNFSATVLSINRWHVDKRANGLSPNNSRRW